MANCKDGLVQRGICLPVDMAKQIDAIFAVRKRLARPGTEPKKWGVWTDLLGPRLRLVDMETGQVAPDLPVRREMSQELPVSVFASNEDLYGMVDVWHQMSWVARPNNECIHVNPALVQFTGRPADDFHGVGWAKVLHPDDVKRICQLCRDGFHAREPFEVFYRVRRADGLYGWVRDYAQPFYRPTMEVAGYVGVMRVMGFEPDLSSPESIFDTQTV